MEFKRRDALAALGVVGAAGGVLAASRPGAERDGSLTGDEVGTLVALAEVRFPSGVTGVAEFVEAFAVGGIGDRSAYRSGMADGVAALDSHATDRFGAPFADLTPGERGRLLDGLGVDVAEPDPDGGVDQRVRYDLVNELPFAFYASHVGMGALVGQLPPA